MAFVEMKKEMLTGNKEIDSHHRHLVELFNTFLGAFRLNKHREEIGGLLDDLVDYATYHFNAEELWMVDLRYPGAAVHCEEHGTFISRLTEIQKDYAAGRVVSLEVLAFLSRWLRAHLYGADVKVGRYSRQHGVCAKAA